MRNIRLFCLKGVKMWVELKNLEKERAVCRAGALQECYKFGLKLVSQVKLYFV